MYITKKKKIKIICINDVTCYLIYTHCYRFNNTCFNVQLYNNFDKKKKEP